MKRGRDSRIELVGEIHTPINHRCAVEPILFRTIFSSSHHVRVAIDSHVFVDIFIAGLSFVSLDIVRRFRLGRRRRRRGVDIK